MLQHHRIKLLLTVRLSRIPSKVAPLPVRVVLSGRRRRSTSCHRSLFPFSLFLSNCFHLFLVGVLGWVLFKFVLPAGVCAGLLCLLRLWCIVARCTCVLGHSPMFGPVTLLRTLKRFFPFTLLSVFDSSPIVTQSVPVQCSLCTSSK